MNKFEFFTMIFFVLDHYWDEHKGDDLGMFLSGMNPFLFEGEGSAVPDVYTDFCDFMKNKKVTIDSSFAQAKKYIEHLNQEYLNDAFAWVEEDEWKQRCKKYIKKLHGE